MKLALYPLVQQFQFRNGTNLVAGRIYVYYRGRTRLATIYKDQNGTIAQNPLTCDADGRAPCFVDSNYQYTIVVCDARGKELFSQDLDADNAININDALSGDSKLYIINSDGTISVNATSGDSWIQYDLGTFNKPLGVTEPLYWEKDDEEGSIIGLHTDGLVSGVSADLTELSGKVNELSATKMDKSQSAEFYPSNNPSGFIGAEGLSNYQPVSGMTAYQEKGDYYSASNPSGFITDAALSVYAKKEELTAYQSAGDYYSASNPSGFINSDAISDMATTGFVANVSADITAMIPTALTGDYLTKESADTLYQPIGDYVNQNELSNVSADITAMIPTAMTGDYLDKASADKLYYGIDNPSGFITGVDLTPYQTIEGMTAYQTAGNYYSASNPSGFITNDAITGLQPSGDYATNTQLCAVSSTITGMIPSGEFELCAGNGIELVDDPNAKTTTISVTAQGGNPEVEQAVIENSASWNTVGDKLDTTAFSNVSGTFLTAHQDLSDYQTTAGMTAYQPTGDYLTAVPNTYLQNTDLEITNNKITGISGVPLAGGGGGDVPVGVMSESGLEYNAVNEISGYNGSAIAQYGAEKQWLQHDDTIVHVANSAQYAFGVNLSAVAQLLGVDETVLWENTTSAYTKDITWPQSLSENITGFTKVKFLYAGDDSYKPKYSEFVATEGEYELTDFFQQLNNTGYMFIRFSRFRLSGTNFTNTNNMTINCINNQNWQDLSNLGWNKVYKVIGIGRKA